MKKGFIWKFFASLAILSAFLFVGCSLTEYEIEEEGHVWKFYGLIDDSTAIVKVTFEQWGTEEDHHLMGWDDDFHWTKETRFYPVRMNSYWLGHGHDSSMTALSENNQTNDYTLRSESLDDYSGSCGIILSDKKGNDLDTLEIDQRCNSDTAKFIGNYARIDNSFYLIKDGKFPKQKPAYRFEHVGRNIKFIDANNNYIIYGGKP